MSASRSQFKFGGNIGRLMGIRALRSAFIGELLRWQTVHACLIWFTLLLLVGGCSKRRFRQASSSMFPTIQSNEVVVADMAAYRTAGPQRWDAIVFHPPPSTQVPEQFWVMRVVGLPGERLEIRDDGIYVDGKRQSPPEHLAAIPYVPGISLPQHPVVSQPYIISPGCYFVLGDNSTNAFDSRYWGELSNEYILGRVQNK